MNSGKAPGMDGVKGEMLKAGIEVVAEWMTRIARICMKEGRVHEDWQEAYVVPIYEKKDKRSECKKS